jgi:hypothetical protein
MLQVGFLRGHPNDDRHAPGDAGDPHALRKFLHLSEERLHVTLEEEVQRFGRVDALCIEINILLKRVEVGF